MNKTVILRGYLEKRGRRGEEMERGKKERGRRRETETRASAEGENAYK